MSETWNGRLRSRKRSVGAAEGIADQGSAQRRRVGSAASWAARMRPRVNAAVGNLKGKVEKLLLPTAPRTKKKAPPKNLKVQLPATQRPTGTQSQDRQARADKRALIKDAELARLNLTAKRLEAQRLAKLEAQRLAKLEAQRLAKLKAERLAKLKAQRLAKLKAERLEAQRLAKATLKVAKMAHTVLRAIRSSH